MTSTDAGRILFRFCKEHASTLLAIGASVGVVITSIEASKATLKAEKIVLDKKQERAQWEEKTNIPQPELSKGEIVESCWKVYIPSVAFGAATIGCIIAASVISSKQHKSLLAAYAMIDQSYKAYRKKVCERYGEDVDREIANEIIEETEPDDFDANKLLFYDIFSERYFESTMRKVQEGITYVNRELNINGYASLNDMYHTIGICETEDGSILGWNCEDICEWLGISWLDFEIKPTNLGDGTICYVINPVLAPNGHFLGE